MGDALQADHTAGDMGVWPSELDEQLISDLLTDDDTTLLEALQVPLDLEYCSRDTGAVAAPSCNSGGDRSIAADEYELLQPAAVSRALCSVYSGPTIRDVEKALTSRSYPCTWSNRRYSSTYLFRGVSRGAPESKYTTKVRCCAGKMPSDGFKWRKYGQKSIKNNPHVRSYYKCTSSRCGAKKHVEKSVDDPEMLVVTYEGSHLHGPQPLSPRRQWAVDLSGVAAAAKKAAKGPSPTTSAADADNGGGGGMEDGTPNQTTTRDAEARGVGTAGKPPVGRQGGRTVDDAVPRVETTEDSCDGSAASVAATWAADTVLPCDSPPTDNWPCLDLDYFPWSPEPLLL